MPCTCFATTTASVMDRAAPCANLLLLRRCYPMHLLVLPTTHNNANIDEDAKPMSPPKICNKMYFGETIPNWLDLRNFKICALVLLLYKRKYEQNKISFSSTAYVFVRTIFSKKNGYYHSSPQSLHLVESATMKPIYL